MKVLCLYRYIFFFIGVEIFKRISCNVQKNFLQYSKEFLAISNLKEFLARIHFFIKFVLVKRLIVPLKNSFRILRKLLSRVSSKFLRDLIGNSYCKKDYSKGEVNVVNITQIRLK